ncbi:CTP synthase [Labeo rohita]|uniref:CTP synthase n=1 Tax=Labeo rohita TaxID=84645 RepID=A0ABQ8MUP7_LABRO|nr:CTP synthase [Labeo rohita]
MSYKINFSCGTSALAGREEFDRLPTLNIHAVVSTYVDKPAKSIDRRQKCYPEKTATLAAIGWRIDNETVINSTLQACEDDNFCLQLADGKLCLKQTHSSTANTDLYYWATFFHKDSLPELVACYYTPPASTKPPISIQLQPSHTKMRHMREQKDFGAIAEGLKTRMTWWLMTTQTQVMCPPFVNTSSLESVIYKEGGIDCLLLVYSLLFKIQWRSQEPEEPLPRKSYFHQ